MGKTYFCTLKAKMRPHFITFLCFICLLSALTTRPVSAQPKREVRAVWLTTIGGLDWPKHKATGTRGIEAQKEEFRHILDRLKAANFNTVLLQTRIRSTVIYPSAIEPWDDCLTGRAGRNPGYDPLRFAINECHKRGLQLHAWVVAFPCSNFKLERALGSQSIRRRRPDLCLKTNDFWLLNPGEPGTADYLAELCSEIVDHYDVDGIHLDYIRYPEKEVRFNDAATYRKYGRGTSLAQWRRDNVTRCVRTIYNAVKSRKPWVRVSCSPVGKFDDVDRFSSRGWNAYSKVYQDAQGWLREGIMDMLVPMMYFQGDHFFPFALDWKEQSAGRLIVPGLGAYMLQERNWELGDLQRQNAFLRLIGADGQAYFRSQFVTNDTKGLYAYLKNDFYAFPALVPAMTWQRDSLPDAPSGVRLHADAGGYTLSWEPVRGDGITYNLYRSYSYPVKTENVANLISYGLDSTTFRLNLNVTENLLPYYAIRAMDRFGNESQPVEVNAPPTVPASLTTARLHLERGQLKLPSTAGAEFLMVTDAAEREVLLCPFDTVLDMKTFQPGIYTIRTLGKKGRSHTIGKVVWR